MSDWSHVWLFATPWTTADPMGIVTPMDPLHMPGLPVHHELLKLAQIHVHWVSDAIQPSHPLLPASPLALNPSISIFSSELALYIRWPKCWSFNFSISPSSKYSKLISFRIDWFDLLAIQGTLKSLLQHCSSKTSILRHSASFMVQLLYLYMTTGKTFWLLRVQPHHQKENNLLQWIFP